MTKRNDTLPRNRPRSIEKDEVFYYVNDKSVDLVVWTHDRHVRVVRLRQKTLKLMLSELR